GHASEAVNGFIGIRTTVCVAPSTPTSQSCSASSSQTIAAGVEGADATIGDAARLSRSALPSDSNPRTSAADGVPGAGTEGIAMKMRPFESTVNGTLAAPGA